MSLPTARAALRLLRPAPVLAVLATGSSLTFLTCMWSATGGRFVPQNVDLYLVCQYAKAMAEGHPFQYYAGDPGTTGATSLLHTAVLALAHGVGLRGEGLIAFAVLTGALLLVVSTELARRLGTLLGGVRTGWLAGALVALGGPVVWGYLYGSDVAPFSALALWLLLELALGWPELRVGRLAVVGVLIALARPEGLLIALALGAASWWAPGRREPRRLLLWAPLAAALGVLAVNRMATGAYLGTSIADKSLVATYGLPDALALTSEFLVDVVRGLLIGVYPSQAPIGFARGWAPLFFPPGGLVLVLLALVHSSRAGALRWWAATVGVVCLLVTPNMFMGTQFNRYLLWAFPGLLVLAAVGLHLASAWWARGDVGLDRTVFAAGSALFLALGALATLRLGVEYGSIAGVVARRDLAVSDWIRREVRPGQAIANLATSVEYLTGHRSLNLHGVTTPGFLGNRPAEREANVIESLARLPRQERPTLLMATEAALDTSPALRELVSEPPVFRTTSLGDEIVVLPMDYRPLDGNDEPRRAETLEAVRTLAQVDRLNVCDPRDEAAHDYRVASFRGNLRLSGSARVARYDAASTAPETRVADGGRAVLGHERFAVATTPGRDLLVVLRTAPETAARVWTAAGAGVYDLSFPDASITLSVDDQRLGTATFAPRAGWDELLMKVEGARITRARTTLELRGRYASYRYWFYQ
jgi:hypothetical protein